MAELKTNAILGSFEGKACDTKLYNNNDMYLGGDLFDTLIASDDYKRAMDNHHYIGFLGHPKDVDCQDYEHACIVMTDMRKESNGDIWAKFNLINTPVGKIVKAFIDAGVKFGISIRGAGDVAADGKVDGNTFVFRGFDLVTFPAYDDAIPEFKPVTASTDPKIQQKRKILASTLKENLQYINNADSLDILQKPFNENSEEHKLIDDRLQELNAQSEDDPKSDKEYIELLQKKLDAMTNLYLEQFNLNKDLNKELNECKVNMSDIQLNSSRVISKLKRISASQTSNLINQLDDAEKKNKILASSNAKLKQTVEAKTNAVNKQIKANEQLNSDLQDLHNSAETLRASLDNLTQENKKLITANTNIKDQARKKLEDSSDLQSQLQEIQQSNLIYKQKIEANTSAMTEKDSKISELESQLSETVASNEALKKDLSNRDNEMNRLQSTIKANEQIIGDYQQAYADLCAGAIGVHLTNIPVNASTTVDQLQNYIYGSTSSNTSYNDDSLDNVDVVGDDYNDDGLVSL